jgi:hypothetical protein
MVSLILLCNKNSFLIYLFKLEIYDDSDGDHEEMLSSSSPIPPTTTTTTTTTISNLRTKVTPNLTSNIPALTEEAHNGDYADAEELDAYQNEDHHDPETTNQDDSQLFDEKISINDPDQNSVISDPNNRKNSNLPSSRIPFVPSNLWRDLFSKPGILVGKFLSSILNSFDRSFRYCRWSCYRHVICYLTCYVYNLSNA